MVNIENFVKSEQGIQEDEIYHALHDLKKLYSTLDLKMFTDEWNRIFDLQRPSNFTIALVGDFSNGKSTFINKLLGRGLLPTGDLPTTALLTKICYGSRQSMWWVKDGRKTELDFSQNSMDKITTSIDGIEPDGYVLVEVPDDWLKMTGIEIIDTPGIDNTTEKKYELVKNLIYSSSATIIAANSMRALSEKERQFIYDHILSRKIPHIAIAITRLDQVPEKDQSRIIDYIRGKTGIWLKDMPIFVINDQAFDQNKITALGPAEIKQYLAKWESSENNDVLKREQVTSQLIHLLIHTKYQLSEMRSIAVLQDAEKIELKKIARQKIMENKQNWEVLRSESDKLELKCIEWVRNELLCNKNSISNKLIDEMYLSSNLKEWYEKDFVFKIRLYVKDALSRIFDEQFEKYVDEDIEKLDSLAQNIFSRQLNNKTVDVNVDGAEYSFGITRGIIKDIETRKRQIDATGKIVSGAVHSGVLVLKASKVISKKIPYFNIVAVIAAPAVEGTFNIVSEVWTKWGIEKQKRELEKAIPEIVEEQLRETLKPITREVHSVYHEITNTIIKHESEWADFQLSELSRPDKDKEECIKRIDDGLYKIDHMLKSVNKEV